MKQREPAEQLASALRGESVFRVLKQFSALVEVTDGDLAAWASNPEVIKVLGQPMNKLAEAVVRFDAALPQVRALLSRHTPVERVRRKP